MTRPVLPSDLDLLARVMLVLPAHDRAAAMADLLARADIADRYRKRTGKRHPAHGDGSVLCLALGQRAVAPCACGAAYLAALAGVVASLTAWRDRRRTYHHP